MNSLTGKGASEYYSELWGLWPEEVFGSWSMWPFDIGDNGASYPGHRIYFLGRDVGWKD
jgi:hypothetical protein